jgi:isoleucyl-tRNA synthetase
MDGLRDAAVAEANAVRWIPEWGRERMTASVVNRPDWCISRQRAWGVPIPALACRACGVSTLTPEIVERAAKVFDEHGADAWYELETAVFVPTGLTCESCGAADFDRERDILDVWFDSGSSHEAVLAPRPDLSWPADVYLEGTDQHRGWFQSSLLVGVGTRDRAPYRTVVTHGFVVDERGGKMSKSLGNIVVPQDVMNASGAEVLRLWVAMVDFRDEVRVGKEVLSRTIEAYRKIRNTFRYLLANLYDFDPARHLVADGRLLDVDAFALAIYARLAETIRAAYERYDFQAIFHAVNEFLTVDLSAFYLDVSKDRLYTFPADSVERRSAQTAQYVIADGLTRLIAPILSVTAEEVWARLPGSREESVHIALFPADTSRWRDDDLERRWTQLLDLRRVVYAALETARNAKVIGASLTAHVTVRAPAGAYDLLTRHEADLPMLFIVSSATVERLQTGPDVQVEVARASGEKCPRCWRFVSDAAAEGDQAGLCARCVAALGGNPVAATR